jgi:hypothetical protein
MVALCFSLGVLVAALSLPACTDDNPATGDGSVSDGTKDTNASEQGTPDKGVVEGGQGDGTPVDGTPADGTPVDGTPADGTPADGTPVDGTPGDGTPADGTPFKRCKNDGDCKVFQDCCSCRGVLTSENPPICKKACKRSTCDVWFAQPESYCVNGRCKVGEGAANSCGNTTKSCRLINDCCRCLAVPASNTSIPACSIKACFVDTCTGQGLSTARAVCTNGNCRLSTVSP